MLVREILSALDAIAPLRYAEPWDNVGLLAGDEDAPVARVLLTIDLTHAVLDEAIQRGTGLIVSYHPPLFEAIKRVRHGSIIDRAIRANIAIFSPHTALDVAPSGTNDMLADALGLTARAPLKITPAKEALATPEQIGIGRVGTFDPPAPRAALVERVKQALALETVLVAGPLEGLVSRAAVCAGAGRGLFDEAIAQRVDLYLTGELPHHDALRAAAAGITVVCTLHSNSERATLRRLAPRLEEAAPGIEVSVSEVDRDPFTFR